MRRTVRRAALAAAICFLAAIAHQGYAVAATLSLLSTKITSRSNDLTLTLTPVQVFNSVPLTCPASKTCTMRIEVSALLAKVFPSVEAFVFINDSGAGILPGSVFTLGSGEFPSSPTFTVWRGDLPPGIYSVRVKFKLNFGGGGEQGGTGFRTLTVQMFTQ
jgi:hypothetical protein